MKTKRSLSEEHKQALSDNHHSKGRSLVEVFGREKLTEILNKSARSKNIVRWQRVREYCKARGLQILNYDSGTQLITLKCSECSLDIVKPVSNFVLSVSHEKTLLNFICSTCLPIFRKRVKHTKIAENRGLKLNIAEDAVEVDRNILHVVCPEGHNFTTTIDNYVKSCPSCVEDKRQKRTDRVLQQNIALLNPDQTLLSYIIREDGHIDATVRCSKGHEFVRTSCNLKHYTGCPLCIRDDERFDKRQEVDEFLVSNGFKLISDYIKHDVPIKLSCTKKNHIFEVRYNYFVTYPKCPVCDKYTSRYEKEIFEFLKQLGICADDLESKSRYVISPYEVDLYSPKKKIAVEFHGLFFHSYEHQLTDFKGDVKKTINYHKIKADLALKKGVRLIQIFEDEWLQNKVVVKELLRNAFGAQDWQVAYARNCEIREVNWNDAKAFLNTYHIGKAGLVGKIRFGLYYQNELVALLTFLTAKASNNFTATQGTFELYKYVTSRRVPGGLSKLLSHFIKQYSPEKIITYVDRRWFTGEGFLKVGFKVDTYTEPNYYYFKPGDKERIHRFALRKTWKGEPTEKERRYQEGYRRLYDAGHIKMIYIVAEN